MTTEATTWKVKRYDDGQEVMLKSVRCDNLKQSFELAYHVAEAMIGTGVEKDFSVSADPTAAFIVLHAYSKNELPSEYALVAEKLDSVLNVR
jgi:hypothetical protein